MQKEPVDSIIKRDVSSSELFWFLERHLCSFKTRMPWKTRVLFENKSDLCKKKTRLLFEKELRLFCFSIRLLIWDTENKTSVQRNIFYATSLSKQECTRKSRVLFENKIALCKKQDCSLQKKKKNTNLLFEKNIDFLSFD